MYISYAYSRFLTLIVGYPYTLLFCPFDDFIFFIIRSIIHMNISGIKQSLCLTPLFILHSTHLCPFICIFPVTVLQILLITCIRWFGTSNFFRFRQCTSLVNECHTMCLSFFYYSLHQSSYYKYIIIRLSPPHVSSVIVLLYILTLIDDKHIAVITCVCSPFLYIRIIKHFFQSLSYYLVIP